MRILLKRVLPLIVAFAALAPFAARASLSEVYGYPLVAQWQADGSYEGWTGNKTSGFISPELDLTGCTMPTLFLNVFSENPTIEISTDGVSYTTLSKLPTKTWYFDEEYRLPKETKRLRVRSRASQTPPYLVVICDMGYGLPLTVESTATAIRGRIDGNTIYLTPEPKEWEDDWYTDYKAQIRLTPKTTAPAGCFRTLTIIDKNNDIRSLKYTITVTKNDGSKITPASICDDGDWCLLPVGTKYVDILLEGYSEVEAAEVPFILKELSIKDYFYTRSTYAETPKEDFGLYYDIDGDGVFESSGGLKFLKNDEGKWQLTAVYDAPDFDRIHGMEPDGYFYYHNYGRESYTSIPQYCRYKNIGDAEELVLKMPTHSATMADYDLDGKNEILYRSSYSSDGWSVLTPRPDGSFAEGPVTTMTPAEYAGVRSELQLSTGGEGIPGWGDMFGRDGADKSEIFGSSTVVDINSDGLPDFIDTNSGKYFLNTGTGSFVKSSFGNRVCFRDFDGDGINDVLISEYGKGDTKLYLGADTSKEPITLANGLTFGMIFTRDVDSDGDLDVVAFTRTRIYNTGDSYVIIFENQGNGKFRRREHFIEEGIEFTTLLDIDADGKYEAVGYTRNSTPNRTYLVKIESPSSVKTEIIADDNSLISFRPDKSGEWILYGERSDFYKSFPANKRPAKPAAPTLVYDPATKRLSVSWPLGKDTETPALDLSYELRVGTAPGLGDIVTAQALADGTRRNLMPGRNGYSTHTTYNTGSWPEGKIYISYQVIDDGFMGSEFSEPAVFEKTTPASDFSLSTKESLAFTVGLTIEATPSFTLRNGTEYTWSFADGEVISLDPATQKATVRFTAPGLKTISLTATTASGERSVSEKTVKIEPLAVKNLSPSFSGTIDIDGDGYAEVQGETQLYTENASGEYESVKKSFNTSADYRRGIYADVNRDGLADIIGYDYFYINYGDGDMEKTVAGAKTKEWDGVDFNNDGLLDVSPTKLNTGDYLSCTETDFSPTPPLGSYGFYPVEVFFYDFNGDGLMDFGSIAAESTGLSGRNLPFHIYENIDGFNYKRGREISEIVAEPKFVDDLDGDGKADFVMCDASYNFGVTGYAEFVVIIWGSGAPMTKIQCPDGDPFREVTGVFDFNNDGMKDLSVALQNSSAVVSIFRDKSYTFTSSPGFDAKYGMARRHDGSLKFTTVTIPAAPNERPTPPTALRSTQNSSAVVIEWNAGTDKETPVTGLNYNISVKRKGAEGDGAYLISPNNGGSDICALPSSIRLLNSTKFTIPIASIPAGEYEVAVQTVDWQNMPSAFSEVYNLTVRESALVEMPASGMVGTPVEVSVKTNADASAIDFGADATVTTEGRQTFVTWSSEGLKDVKKNGESIAGIYIHPVPDASFTLAGSVLGGSTVTVSCASAERGVWEVTDDDLEYHVLPAEGKAEIISSAEGSLTLRVNKEKGFLRLRHTISEDYGSVSYEQTTDITEVTPVIDLVTADSGNRHRIVWDATALPFGADQVRVYREGSRYNVYEPVAEVPASSGEFTDPASDARVKAARYRISYVLPYGESALSTAHQPMHVQVNRGTGSAINLSWSRYEGTEVDSYRILKGSEPEALSVLDVVSGHITSFSDMAEDASTSYYSIELVPSAGDAARMSAKVRASEMAARSNVVSGSEARDIILAEEVVVNTVDGARTFDGRPALSLQARMLPTDATMTRVNWEVVDGSEYMSVDNFGTVTAKAYGKGRVRATALDGSGAYGEIELENNVIPLTFFQFEKWPENHTLRAGESFRYEISIKPTNATEKPVWSSTNPEVATVTQDGLVTALTAGETDIYVRSELNPELFINLSLTVTHSEDFVEVQSIRCTNHSFEENIFAEVGEVYDFVIEVLPENATDKSLRFTIYPETTTSKVATVDENGRVTIVDVGRAALHVESVSNPLANLWFHFDAYSGIDSVFADGNARHDVYNLAGVCVLRDASREDLRKLPAGFYIAGGRKIHVLPE